MANIMQFLRMRNLFGQPSMGPDVIGNDLPSQGGITGNMTGPRVDDYGNTTISPQVIPGGVNPAIAGDTGYDAGARMNELYTPETAASDRFNKMVGDYPKREDYHPSMLRKIGGALTAVGSSFDPHGRFQFNPQGIGMGMNLVDKPFNDKLADWKNQIGPAQTAANLERSQNVNERTMAYQTVAQELRQHAQDAKDKNDTKKLEISENRAKVYEFKAHHPGAKFDFSGPTVKVADPIKGTVEDTNIPTGHMSKLDQMNLAQEFERENIGSKGKEAVNLENAKEKNRETLEDKKQPNRLAVKGTPSGNTGTGGKPESPTQTRVRQFNAARELYNSDPQLRQFIKIGSPGSSDFTVTAPSEGFFGHNGPTAEQYKKIKDTIYGNTAPAPVASHAPAPAKAGTNNTPTEDRVQIKDNVTGKVVATIPRADAARLNKQKYSVVE